MIKRTQRNQEVTKAQIEIKIMTQEIDKGIFNWEHHIDSL